jgi:hypothetical protein
MNLVVQLGFHHLLNKQKTREYTYIGIRTWTFSLRRIATQQSIWHRICRILYKPESSRSFMNDAKRGHNIFPPMRTNLSMDIADERASQAHAPCQGSR